MGKRLSIIGAGLAIGAATAAVLYLSSNNRRKSYDLYCDNAGSDDKRVPIDNKPLTEVSLAQEMFEQEDVKSSAIGKMYFRHEDTATVMRDSVKTIRENAKISESTNYEIDNVSAELDKMLSEDER